MLMSQQVGVPASAKVLKDQLAAADARLGILLMPNALGDGATLWGVTYKWNMLDPRRAEVQRGDRREEDAFDILGFLPADCPIDTAFDYILNRFRWPQDRSDLRNIIDRVHEHNRKVKEAALQPTMDLANELIETNARHLFKGIGKSTGSSLDVGQRSKRDDRDWKDYLEDTARGS